MRITQNNFYNTFINDQQSIKQQLEAVSRQISSGMKIKYGYEDPSVFTDTLRLDYEEHSLSQAVSVATDAQNFANNTDSVMFQFTDALTRFKTLLIQAANGANADSNYFAISNEMKSLKQHLIDLGNSSINGRFLFSGSKLDTKPLDDTGRYHGNGEELKAVVGADVEIPYNISGEELFLGEDSNVSRVITTNLVQKDSNGEVVGPETTIGEWTGGTGMTFVVAGRTSDGTIFQEELPKPNPTVNPYSVTDTVQDVLNDIADIYGSDSVNVRMNNGLITVEDKMKGSSLLDLHLFAVDNNGKEYTFIQSVNDDDNKKYDTISFEKTGKSEFRGNVPQIVKADNSVATGSTKLQETAGIDLSSGRTLNIGINGVDAAAKINIDETTSYRELMNQIESSVASITGNPAKVFFDDVGRIVVESEGLNDFSLHDATSPSILFNANNALTVDDPKHDFFAAIDEAIEAVENGLLYPDGTSDTLSRNPGIENALARIDHLIEHVGKEHTKIGAMSNSLQYAVERSETLKLNVQSLRSDVLDTDIGEATMKLNQLSLNYQAMMASIARVQNLSLVNYL